MPTIAQAVAQNESRSKMPEESISQIMASGVGTFPSGMYPEVSLGLPQRSAWPASVVLDTDFRNTTKVFRHPQSVGVRSPTFPTS